MPYRRLPNTDKARLKALRTALVKGRELPPFKLAFSQRSNQKLQAFIGNYENAMTYYSQNYIMQTKKNYLYTASMKKAKMYISHFIQVMNMAIMRGELPVETKKYFGLSPNEARIPALNTENDIINWGEKLIKGEAQRLLTRNTPVTNPTIALVKVRYENFLESHHYQKTLQKNTLRALDRLTELRKEADDIILRIWNEVEDTYKELPDDLKREKAQEYGLIYVFRKGEVTSYAFCESRKSGM
jgi:hypothetical protein